MLLFNGEDVWDFDLNFFEDVVDLVDRRLDELERNCDASGDPDQFGLFDQTEHICGLGFTAAQTYMVSVCGEFQLENWQSYSYGPRHECGEPVALLVHHAANYWKHRIQWTGREPDAKQRRTIEGLAAMELGGDYPLSTALASLTGTDFPRLRPLVPLLVAWRASLIELARTEGSGVEFRSNRGGV